MIARVVRWALRVPESIVVFSIVVVALGLWAYQQLDIEAYPNPVPPMIEVVAQPNGLSAAEVARTVTIPIESELSSAVDLAHIRSISLSGLSDVKCYFRWSADIAIAQQRILNRLSQLRLPEGLAAKTTGWSPIGEVYRYRLSGKDVSLADLRSAQDWILEREFRQVPGVIDVIGFGGEAKQYQVLFDPISLKANGVKLKDALRAIGVANQIAGSTELPLGQQSINVRSTTLLQSLDDVRDITVPSSEGAPIRLRDFAVVSTAAAPRLGQVGMDGDGDVVEGIVLMRAGGDSNRTIQGIRERVEFIRTHEVLPKGMTIEPVYDRETYLERVWRTVHINFIAGMLLVFAILILAFGHVRAAAIAVLNAPVALMVANIFLWATGTPANLISFASVNFGIVLVGTVLTVDAVFRTMQGDHTKNHLDKVLRGTSVKAAAPMVSWALVTAASFIPLFGMKGAAGAIYSPMARMYVFAIAGAAVASLTLTPVLMYRLIPDQPRAEEDHEPRLIAFARKIFRPIFGFAVESSSAAIAAVLIPVVALLVVAPMLGREFLPKLEEGNFWIRATMPLSISLKEAAKYTERMREIVRGCPSAVMADHERARKDCARPEIEAVVTQIGRPDDGTDTQSFYNIEIFAPLRAPEHWRHGVTKREIQSELAKELGDAFPGVVFNFSQAIEDNVDEASSGVKAENVIKVFAHDVELAEATAREIVPLLSDVPGVRDLGIYRSTGQPAVHIKPDRAQAARYGADIEDVEAAVLAAIGTRAVTEVYEGERILDLTVRFTKEYRTDVKAIRAIPIPVKDGSTIPLGQLAQIGDEKGPAIVYREDHRSYVPVKFSVRGRALAPTIAEAKRRISHLKVPDGVALAWSGASDKLHEALSLLTIAVPIELFLITFLVFAAARTWKDTLIAMLGIPVAWAGGVLALLATDTPLSISATMGFMALAGLAVQDGLVVIGSASRLWAKGSTLAEGTRLACERRLRSGLAAALVPLLGVLPMALSDSMGSEATKPLALVVIGGSLALIVLGRILQPALLVALHRSEST